MTGVFVAATMVALLQYFRVRDRRILLLVAMFLLQAVTLSLDWWSVWKTVSQGAVCLAGLALVLLLAPRQVPAAPPPPPEPPPRDTAGEGDRLSS
jgi:hypothetical protein